MSREIILAIQTWSEIKADFGANWLVYLSMPFVAAFGNDQHSFLRFRQHHFIRRHSGFALRDKVKIDFDSVASARTHFTRRRRQTSRAHILHAHDGTGFNYFQRSFEQ